MFLDEIGEMDLNLQAKMLRLIQSGTFQKVGSEETQTVNIRFVCATNREPLIEIAEGRFREDLYYRLNVVPIELPPLRERGSDVITIAENFLEHFNKDVGKQFGGFSEASKELLLAYNWPGNVRELQNVMENVVIMNTGDQIQSDMLPENIRKGGGGINQPVKSGLWGERRKVNSSRGRRREDRIPTDAQLASEPDVITSPDQIEQLWKTEKKAIEDAIRICQNNVPVAAAHLGVSPSTLYRKLKSWEDGK